MKPVAQVFRSITSAAIEHRLLLSLGIAVASGLCLRVLFPWPLGNALLNYVEVARPSIGRIASDTYVFFLYTTPFLLASTVFSLLYVHGYRTGNQEELGRLPALLPVDQREQLELVVGEIHHQLKPTPSALPHWLAIPERGLYTGIAAIGSIGSGKTQALILPAMRQLFGYRASDPARKLSGIVLEVKGDLCRQLRRILSECGRTEDYIEISLDGEMRYNPLNNALDPYAQAFNIASVITSIWGRGKEPFWQQSYTDLVRYVISLHRVRDGYVTLVDVFRTVISAGQLESLLEEIGARFTGAEFLVIGGSEASAEKDLLLLMGFKWHPDLECYIAPRSAALEAAVINQTGLEAAIWQHTSGESQDRDRWYSVFYWYWEHWKFFRPEVKTSIIQGIVVFLSLFETDPQVKRVFCPPKEVYEKANAGRNVVLHPFEELIEQGKVVGLNFPVALNPALAKTIGTLMKVDYQRAVQLRIPRMDAEPARYFRPTVLICDEYQNFATVGGDNPTGDERFLSISRQPKCIPIVATQSISSLKDALPNEGVKTLLQAFRTKIFLTTSDPDTARFASELCGKEDRTRISYTVSESSTNAHVGWLSGRTASNKGSVSASKQYQKHKEPLFEEKVFFDLKNAQSVIVAFDGITPLPATYCYLKPDFLPVSMTWFEQERAGFEPGRMRS